ncbi:MAG: hypothetical protein J7J93_03090, partial [Candidatus Aenigmarchaeota archaeon]|nr:hypothetical protein [Candidatus Aenigmarchaeota archaeon]
IKQLEDSQNFIKRDIDNLYREIDKKISDNYIRLIENSRDPKKMRFFINNMIDWRRLSHKAYIDNLYRSINEFNNKITEILKDFFNYIFLLEDLLVANEKIDKKHVKEIKKCNKDLKRKIKKRKWEIGIPNVVKRTTEEIEEK